MGGEEKVEAGASPGGTPREEEKVEIGADDSLEPKEVVKAATSSSIGPNVASNIAGVEGGEMTEIPETKDRKSSKRDDPKKRLLEEAPPKPWYRSDVGLIVLLMVASICVVLLSIFLTDAKAELSTPESTPTQAPTFAQTLRTTNAPSIDRETQFLQYIVDQGISNAEDFFNPESPQYLALEFIANQDALALEPPAGGLNTTEGYTFLTRYAMTLVYYAMNGENWVYDLLFLSDLDTCDWFELFAPPIGQLGVLCDTDSNEIVGMSFAINELGGFFPTEIGLLTSMTYIESIGNDVAGSIPNEFSQLTDLTTLVLVSNQMTGSLPTWIGQLDKLVFFYASNNMFTGSIPQNIDSLSQLEGLALDDNVFTGSTESLWNFSKLLVLTLDDNAFTGTLPDGLANALPLLAEFDASSNFLEGQLPLELFRWPSLDILDLHENRFTGEIPSDISAVDGRLKMMALHRNALTSAIPPTLGNLRMLEHLDLSSNALTGALPTELDNLNQLTSLFLAENNFDSGPIPTFLYSLDGLQELSLKSTKRNGVISELIGLWSKLVLLDLDDNGLTGTIPNELGVLYDMHFLLLNQNQLSGTVPTELGGLGQLVLLLLDGNNLTGTLEPVCAISDLSIVIADCLEEVDCPCCNICCSDDQPDCHDMAMVASLDPLWETSFERIVYSFSEEATFPWSTMTNSAIALRSDNSG